MPSIKSLKAFVLTMEHGSLTLAAEAMNLSQPAASRLLQQLEAEFGEPLFYRNSKTLSPSRDAALFYPEASRIVASIEALPEVIRTLKQDAAVPLKVIGQTRCTLGLVAPALARLNQENSDVAIDFETYKRVELRRRLIWDRFDVGVFALPLHLEYAVTVFRRRIDCQVLVPLSHPLVDRDRLIPDDLVGYDRVAVAARSSLGEVEDKMAREGYEIPIKHEVSNAFAAVSLVRLGLGYVITDRLAVDPSNMDDLRFIPISPTPSIEYAICVSPEMRDHPVKERFIEILVDSLNAV
jgi:DNA-binding transcriptional LysR family regulator